MTSTQPTTYFRRRSERNSRRHARIFPSSDANIRAATHRGPGAIIDLAHVPTSTIVARSFVCPGSLCSAAGARPTAKPHTWQDLGVLDFVSVPAWCASWVDSWGTYQSTENNGQCAILLTYGIRNRVERHNPAEASLAHLLYSPPSRWYPQKSPSWIESRTYLVCFVYITVWHSKQARGTKQGLSDAVRQYQMR
ncbi:hypothetical protein DENSPDRAFT_193983 [Dentipellis sp. KUC8613]|nr:hypothetical protein DENSPDRAFT_193983 [Dentipellis sp. KUC8613]